MVRVKRGIVLVYIGLITAIFVSILLFEYTGLSKDPLFFRWAILYYGSAVVQAYATIIAVPFTIWVIYMQSRYGYIMIRLYINRVVLPFALLVVISITTSITMSYSETGFAYYAFLVEYAVSLLLLPPIIYYIRELMTMNPERVVNEVIKLYSEPGEALSMLFHILRLVLIEAYPEERVINSILRLAVRELSRRGVKLNPDTVHRFRDFLRSVVVESTYLPDMRIMRDVMKHVLAWCVSANRLSIARGLIRAYTRVAIKYFEEYLPTITIYNLFIEPVVINLKELKARRSLIGYALEQLIIILNRIRTLGSRGDISSFEICRLLDVIQKNTEDLSDLREYEKLYRALNEVRAEFACPSLK
ncbi:MAG: hypothetical protein ABWW65_01340 [Thermoprotei archaeon]